MVSRAIVAAAALGAAWGANGNMVFSQGSEPSQLPAVEAVLTKAAGKAVDFAAQAMAMQKMVEESQRKGRDALAAQKADYERQLAEQAAASRALTDRNAEVSKHIADVRAANDVLKQETAKLQAGNAHMRTMLQHMSEKVSAASLFVADSLKTTDDSGAEVLRVLVPTTPRPTLTRFLEQAGASFLQISKGSHGSHTPEDLVQVLSHSLGDIAEAQKEGAAELKAHFMSSFEEARLKQEELMAQQQSLNTTLNDQLAHQQELEAAKTHLVSIRDSLKQRLHGLRIFARKLDQTAHDAVAADDVKPTPSPSKQTQHKVHTSSARTTTTTSTTTSTTTTSTTTATTTTTTTAVVLVAKPSKAAPIVQKAKPTHPPKDFKHVKVEKVKVAALVEASSENSGKKVEKPAAAREQKAVPAKAKHAKSTEPTANNTRTTKKTGETGEETKEAHETQSPSRLHSWFAAWR